MMARRVKLKARESLVGLMFALPSIAGILIFFLLPFLQSVKMSINLVALDVYPWYYHYAQVIESFAFRIAAISTIRFVLIGVPLNVLLSLIVAAWLNGAVPLARFSRSALVLPLVIPTAAVILVFRAFFADAGFINLFLTRAGLSPISFMSSGASLFVVLVLYLWKNLGYGMVLFTAGLNGIPREVYEAGRIDGASEKRMFFSLTLPLIRPTTAFVAFVSVINAFKVFREAFVLAGAYPDRNIYMIQHFMNNNFENLNYQRLSVSAVLIFLFVLLMMGLFRLFSRRGDK